MAKIDISVNYVFSLIVFLPCFFISFLPLLSLLFTEKQNIERKRRKKKEKEVNDDGKTKVEAVNNRDALLHHSISGKQLRKSSFLPFWCKAIGYCRYGEGIWQQILFFLSYFVHLILLLFFHSFIRSFNRLFIHLSIVVSFFVATAFIEPMDNMMIDYWFFSFTFLNSISLAKDVIEK